MPGTIVLPFGTEPNHHTWLHAECWAAWRNSREAEAIGALATVGIFNSARPASRAVTTACRVFQRQVHSSQ